MDAEKIDKGVGVVKNRSYSVKTKTTAKSNESDYLNSGLVKNGLDKSDYNAVENYIKTMTLEQGVEFFKAIGEYFNTPREVRKGFAFEVKGYHRGTVSQKTTLKKLANSIMDNLRADKNK